MSAEKMFPDELELDGSQVRRLLARQFPEWASLPLEPVRPMGTDNALFRLGGDMVVRLPRRERTVETLEKELRWLPELAPRLPVSVPDVLARGMPEAGYPFMWSIHRWLEGENATRDRVGDPTRFALDLAQFVRSLEQIDAAGGPAPGRHNFGRGEPIQRRDEAVHTAIAALGDEIDGAAIRSIWEVVVSAPDWADGPVWIHGDLDSRNVLVRDGRLVGIVDFGCLGVGDPACDVMAAWKVVPAEARDVFRHALSVDDATWARARGWALSQALAALSYYTSENNPTLVAEAERWLAEVLADVDA